MWALSYIHTYFAFFYQVITLSFNITTFAATLLLFSSKNRCELWHHETQPSALRFCYKDTWLAFSQLHIPVFLKTVREKAGNQCPSSSATANICHVRTLGRFFSANMDHQLDSSYWENSRSQKMTLRKHWIITWENCYIHWQRVFFSLVLSTIIFWLPLMRKPLCP